MNAPPLIQARAALAEGRVVGMPTDTVYGLAAYPWASEELFRLKGRPPDKAIAVLVGSLSDAEGLVAFPPVARQLAESHWPGPLTLVLSTKDGAIGIRLPDHPLARELLSTTGPLSVTSANRSGEAPAQSDRQAREMFGDQVSYYLRGVCPGGAASTVIEALPGQTLRVLRPGPITL